MRAQRFLKFRLVKFSLLSIRDLLVTAGPAIVLVVLLLWLAYITINPTPPTRLVLATGPENSAYDAFGKRYRDILASHGITVELRPSLGSQANFTQLKDPASSVEVAFMQSGSTDGAEEERAGLVSLGSLFVEPIWIFYREALKAGGKPVPMPLNQLAQFRGLKVNVGPEGSGVPRLIRQLLTANRIEADDLRLGYLENTPAVMALLDGSMDAVIFSSAPDAPLIQMLLQTPGVRLFNFDHAEAYARRLPFLSNVTLPRGIIALERDLPPQSVQLIAPTATLVARDSTHPALLDLLVQAGAQIHSGTGWFRRAGEFPTPDYTEIPVADEAARFYKSGPPLLQRYMPFWLANLVERMWIVLISMLALVVPLTRIVPPLYEWRVRSRVYRWYGQLREVEQEVEQTGASAEDACTEQLQRLDRIENSVNKLSVPLSYADELYALRLHIEMVRGKIRQTRQGAAHTAEATQAN